MSLRHSNIKKFYIWSFFAGFYFIFPIQAIFLLSKGINVGELALFASMNSIFSTLLEIPTGFIADRYSRKLSVSLGFFCTAIAYLLYPFVHGFLSLIPISLCIGLSNSFISGAMDSLIFDELKDENDETSYLKISTRGRSLSQIATACATLFGPILYSLNTSLPFILTSSVYVFLAFYVYSFKENKRPHEVINQLKILGGIQKIIAIKPILIITLIDIFLLLFVNIYYQILFFPKINHLGLEIKYLGFLDAANLLIMTSMMIILPKLIFKNDWANLFTYSMLTAGMFAAFGLSNNLIVAIVFGTLFDVSWSARKYVMPTITNKYFSSHDRALSLSSMSFVSNLGSALLLPLCISIFNKSYIYSIPIALLILLLIFFFPRKSNDIVV